MLSLISPPPMRSLPHLLALLLALSPLATRAADRPNILFIITDDQRADTIAVLTRAIAAYPICHMSRLELLTGSTVFRNGPKGLSPSLPTWPGTFRDAGYRTVLVGKWDSGGRPEAAGFSETRGLFSSGGGGKF